MARYHGLALALICLLISPLSWGAQDDAPVFTSYLAAEGNKDQPGVREENHFECSDTIYAVVEVSDPLFQKGVSEHLLIVKWFNPADRLEQNTRIEFESYGRGTRVWAWLRLSGSSGASIGQAFDPSFGMGAFIGKWRTEVFVDDELIDTHHFDVLC